MAFTTVLGTLWQLFRDQVRLFRLKLQRNHVVLCGLGPQGIELVHDLCAKRQTVVIIEGQENHPDLVSCRAMGALVLIGSPLDRHVLDQAKVAQAGTLLSLFQEDAASIETLMLAYHLNHNRSQGSLRCILQIYDHEMRILLERYEIFKRERAPVVLELFNLFDIGAQLMLRESPALFGRGEPRRLLIVGMGWMGQILLQRAVRSWQIDRLAKQQEKKQARPEPTGLGWQLDTLEVIVVDRDSKDDLKSRLTANHLIGMEGCQVCFREMDVLGIEFLAGKFLPQHDSGNTIDSAFICLPDDRLALLTAVRLRQRFGPGLPLVVRMSTHSGGAELLTTGATGAIHVVGLQDLANTMPLVTNATLEMIAREIHRDYVLDQFARNQTAETNSVLVPWDKLDEGLKESNRDFAAHLDTKLAGIGCEKYPVNPLDNLFEFTDVEVDALAQGEHQRWCEERRSKGWKFGPVKDVKKKLSPSLVDFDKLTEHGKESNRTAIRRIPVWLAKAGFGIRRLSASPTPVASDRVV